jgi:hypothetical protein
LIEMFDRLSAAFFLAARDRPWSEIQDDDDVIWGTTGLPLANFNGATKATFTQATADDCIETVTSSRVSPARPGSLQRSR